jgi:hypothetical protein
MKLNLSVEVSKELPHGQHYARVYIGRKRFKKSVAINQSSRKRLKIGAPFQAFIQKATTKKGCLYVRQPAIFLCITE